MKSEKDLNPAHSKRGEHHRYQLGDLGTSSGSNSVLNGPGTIDINNQGIYIGQAETATPDPYAPNCRNPEYLICHAQQRQDGNSTDLGALPGVNNSVANSINADGMIVRTREPSNWREGTDSSTSLY